MNARVGSSLSRSERLMLRVGRVVVPKAGRPDWTRTWQAELWHLHHGRPRTPIGSHLTFGLFFDAVWLRSDSCKRAWRGTAALCLLVLSTACVIAALAGYSLAGDLACFRAHLALFLVEAPLVVLVTFAITSRRHLHGETSLRLSHRVRGHLFFLFKSGLALMLSFLMSVDLAQPTHMALPFASDLMQTLLCMIFAITGLRWAILDQQERCKQCLLALASPSRVGRPSHNLLEWSGTQQMCRKGHGLLSSPEMESSWCRHSRWLAEERDQQILA